MVTDAAGGVLRWNRGATDTFGYTGPAALGQYLVELIGIADRSEDLDRVMAAARVPLRL